MSVFFIECLYGCIFPVNHNSTHITVFSIVTLFNYNYVIIKNADINLSPKGDLCEAAANLFAFMRLADIECGNKNIAISPIPNSGLGLAINDRIKRASYKG